MLCAQQLINQENYSSLKYLFDHFSVSTNANFEETWTLKTISRFYDQANEEVVSIDQNGFDRFLTYNFGASETFTMAQEWA